MLVAATVGSIPMCSKAKGLYHSPFVGVVNVIFGHSTFWLDTFLAMGAQNWHTPNILQHGFGTSLSLIQPYPINIYPIKMNPPKIVDPNYPNISQIFFPSQHLTMGPMGPAGEQLHSQIRWNGLRDAHADHCGDWDAVGGPWMGMGLGFFMDFADRNLGN